jgi:hypothetical protein
MSDAPKSYWQQVQDNVAEEARLLANRNAKAAEALRLNHEAFKRRQRNAAARARNQILRDLCGTSARAAREDMGL